MSNSVKNLYNKVKEKINAIIEWRSSLSLLYLFTVNTSFWLSVFYLQQEYQLQILVFFAIFILSYDILLTPTDENSVIAHIFLWPFRSFFRTTAFLLLCYSSNELKDGDKEYACWSGYIALLLLLINPVWVYNKTTQKIKNGISNGVDMCIINPLSKIYAAGYYICTFKFLKGLPEYCSRQFFHIRQFFSYIGSEISKNFKRSRLYIVSTIDCYLYQPMKSAAIKGRDFSYYWLFAGWWPSVINFIDRKIGQPVKDRYNRFIIKIQYIVYGYWLSPVAEKVKIILKKQALILLTYTKKLSIRLVIFLKDSILWPILISGYNTALVPTFEMLKDKYHFVEDNVLIYFLAPVCQTVISVVPEKSPFVEDSDLELDDFLPCEDDAESDASWNPDEEEIKRKKEEAALQEKKKRINQKSALIEFPDFNDLGSSDEEFMFDN
uniref:Transmembrane protein n=1 Tax=Strongyloides venezuelensis TaxID=75913 RepID=A0A0K0FXP9_STRVS